ncbi:MAG: hypothetical protein ACODAE_05425 [Gemmatimonadota bacterium]
MRTTHTTFAALAAAALALPFAACEPQEEQFEETPPAEEQIYEDDAGVYEEEEPIQNDGALDEHDMNQAPRDEMP